VRSVRRLCALCSHLVITKEQRADLQHAMEESLYAISQALFAADTECDLDGLVEQPNQFRDIRVRAKRT
jgi:hypothetical protein